MIYGWILIMITLHPDGSLDGGAIDYFNTFPECFTAMQELSVTGQGTGYTCVDDYVDMSGDIEE